MGFLDKLKQQATEVAGKHGDTILDGIDKAGDAVNKATDNKYAHQVGKATTVAKEGVRKAGRPADGGGVGPTGGDGGPR